MFRTTNTNQLRFIEPIVARFGLSVLGLEFISGKSVLLRVYIDNPCGVSVDDCVKVSRELMLYSHVPELSFDRLEVSSPGIPKQIFSIDQLTECLGSKVIVTLRYPMFNLRKINVTVISCGELSASFDYKGQVLEIQYTQIKRINLEE
ncbi:MAG: hypothetical protein QM538_00500 [Methylacidiphilales bacterium]|nr:hypothetical protein [Candidatus Methylacidiphilales bacterium]